MMQTYPERLYAAMLRELILLRANDLPEEKKVEVQFSICVRYEETLQNWLRSTSFLSPAEEIYFFKNAWPKFGCEIHYYKKIYQSLLFKPASKKECWMFYEYELDKIERFFSGHARFYSYLKSARSDLDDYYFLRHVVNNPDPDINRFPYLDYHEIAAAIMGLEKYKLYVRAALKELAERV
jgi:RteC protein